MVAGLKINLYFFYRNDLTQIDILSLVSYTKNDTILLHKFTF